jgi:hypothetical protein
MSGHKDYTGWIRLSFLLIPSVLTIRSDAASWTKLTNLAPGSAGVMLQLTDGTIMVQTAALNIGCD